MSGTAISFLHSFIHSLTYPFIYFGGKDRISFLVSVMTGSILMPCKIWKKKKKKTIEKEKDATNAVMNAPPEIGGRCAVEIERQAGR